MIDSRIAVLFDFPAPVYIAIQKFRSHVTNKNGIRAVSSLPGRSKKGLEYIHAALSVLISASPYSVSRIIGSEAFQCELHEIFSLVSSGKRLVSKKTGNDIYCYLIRMLFIILRKQTVNPFNTNQQKLVQPFSLIAVTCTNLTPSLIAVLIPVRNLDKDIRCLTDYLPVPSIFQLDRIGLIFLNLLWCTKSIFAQRI